MELRPAAPVSARATLRAAFIPVWHVCEPVIRSVIGARLPDYEAEDIVQTIALGIFRVLPKKLSRPGHKWRAYVRKATDNEVRRRLRQRARDGFHTTSFERRREDTLHAAHSEEGHPDTVTDADRIPDRFAVDPLQHAIGSEMSALIRPAFAALAPRQRIVVRARLIGYPDKDIAKIVGMSEATVRQDRLAAFTHLRPPLQSAGYVEEWLGVQGNNRALAQQERRALEGGGWGAASPGVREQSSQSKGK